MKKNYFGICIFAIFAVLSIFSCCKNEVPISVASVSLDKTNLTKIIGSLPDTLTVTIMPDNAANKNVTWTSSDNSVVTVSNGIVSFVGLGTATVTVTTQDGNKTATCAVTVTPPTIIGTWKNSHLETTLWHWLTGEIRDQYSRPITPEDEEYFEITFKDNGKYVVSRDNAGNPDKLLGDWTLNENILKTVSNNGKESEMEILSISYSELKMSETIGIEAYYVYTFTRIE